MLFMRSLKYLFIVSTLDNLFCTASLASTFPSCRFISWFAEYGDAFNTSSVHSCNATLQAYLHGQDTDVVAEHADCILANTTETIKANMASAGVVLGLMPIILANQGPTLAESSILSMERPLLSILLAIGGPSIYPARPFAYYDPLEAINQAPAGFTNSPDGHLTYFAVSALQYLISLAAAANVIAVSLELGLKTVVVWKKRNPYLPLIWVLLPVVLHVGAAIRLHLFVANAASRRQHRLLNVVKQNERLKPDQRVPHSRRYSLRYLLSKTISLYHLFAKIVDGEICPCRFRTTSKLPPLSETKEIDEPYLSYVLALCLPLLSLGHLVVGIMIFSSLLFIGVGDTGSIVLRYCVSALAVQVIRNLEATGYQVALQKAHHV